MYYSLSFHILDFVILRKEWLYSDGQQFNQNRQKRTTRYHLKLLNTEKTTIYVDGWGQIQICGGLNRIVRSKSSHFYL